MSGGLRRMVVCAIGGVLGAALIPSVGQAWSFWTTNAIELDSGTCGQMLQVGADPTASGSATPSFVLSGDGGLSSYAMSVDGVSIGTFTSNGRAVVCISVRTPLADGPHLLTGVELAPRPSMAVPSFAFTVDTVPPNPPSQPSLADYSDSGVQGDGITKYGMVSVIGKADPGDRVQIWRDGGAAVAGTPVNSSGQWLATTTRLPDGVYTLSAVTLDRAGNRSSPSAGMKLVVDSVAPATPGAPAVLGVGQDGRTVLGGTTADDVATIVVYVNGAQFGTASPNRARNWSFFLPALDPGSYTVTVVAVDAADNWSPRSEGTTATIAPPGEEPPAPIIVTPPPGGAPPFQPPANEDRPTVPDGPLPGGRRPPPPGR